MSEERRRGLVVVNLGRWNIQHLRLAAHIRGKLATHDTQKASFCFHILLSGEIQPEIYGIYLGTILIRSLA
jgi:hypothetical protein